jgi:hypothetical protein
MLALAFKLALPVRDSKRVDGGKVFAAGRKDYLSANLRKHESSDHDDDASIAPFDSGRKLTEFRD